MSGMQIFLVVVFKFEDTEKINLWYSSSSF